MLLLSFLPFPSGTRRLGRCHFRVGGCPLVASRQGGVEPATTRWLLPPSSPSGTRAGTGCHIGDPSSLPAAFRNTLGHSLFTAHGIATRVTSFRSRSAFPERRGGHTRLLGWRPCRLRWLMGCQCSPVVDHDEAHTPPISGIYMCGSNHILLVSFCLVD